MNEAPPTKLADLLIKLNQFRVQDVLRTSNTLARKTMFTSLENSYIEVQSRGRYQPNQKVVVSEWSLAFLAKFSLLRSTDNRQKVPTTRDFADLLSLQGNLADPFALPENTDIEGAFFRMAWEQFPFQEAVNRLTPRLLCLLVDSAEGVSGPFDLRAEWKTFTGMSLERFIAVGWAYFAGTATRSDISRHFASTGLFSGKVSEQECEDFLRVTSATYDEFRHLSRKFRHDNPLYAKFEFNVLNQRPLISISSTQLIAPVPRLVLHRITQGVIFDLVDKFQEPGRNSFSEYFGRLFEEYVGRLLRNAFSDSAVHYEPIYGKPQRKGPDWIVVQGDTCIAFECRSSRFSLAAKTTAESELVVSDANRIFTETAKKFPRKIQDLRNGLTDIDVSDCTQFIKVIVTYEPAYLEPTIRRAAKPELSSEESDYLMIGVGDLELLSEWHARFPMKELLLGWAMNRDAAPMSFDIFLRRFAKANGLESQSTFLDQRIKSFLREHFGDDHPPAVLTTT